MKILVLSLLRLGDIIQQEPLLRGLRQKNPDAEIHILINRQFSNIERIFDGVVDRFIYFDRNSLQQGLGEASYNILWSYTQVENLINSLNAEKYDRVLNFTHNKLSAYLMGTLAIPEKRGLYQEDGRFQGLNNRWIRYFNDRFSGNQKSLFHYVELLGKAFDIPVKPVEKIAGRKREKLVLLQCLTSDKKKDWGLEKFQQLKKTIEISLVDYEVCVLGAPFERETLLSVFSEKDLLICDLAEVKKHLQNAAALVTGDTSIKHLAAQVGTPIVELVLGSSDVTKTAAFTSNTVAVQTQVPCAPCGHSQACSQPRQICAEDITVEQVFGAVWDQLSGEKIAARKINNAMERAVWSLYLDKNNAEAQPFYTAACEGTVQEVATQIRAEHLIDWNSQTQTYRSWLQKAKQTLPSRATLATHKNFQSADIADLVLLAQDILKSRIDQAGYFQGFVEALLSRFSQPVQIYDRVDKALQELEELLEIRENFTEQLLTLSQEGVYYAKGIGQLSINGFEEARKSVQRDLEDAGI